MSYPQFTPTQLRSIKEACQIAAKTFNEIRKLIKPSLTEKQIAHKINKIMKSLGAHRLAFRPIVAAGRHSAEPHHKNTTRRIAKNDIVLLDFGCKVNGMCSDFSRTIFLGRPKTEWLKIYKIVQEAQQKVIRFLKNWPKNTSEVADLSPHRVWSTQDTSGIRASFLDNIARNYITKRSYGKYFIHGLGHGIGNKVHQYFKINPKSKAMIKPGAVFTIEPGIYFKGRFGIRIEDTIWLSPKGPQVLTSESQ